MIEVVLVNPEIPPNTGNVIRLCANTGARLHLVEPLGFALDDTRLKRAGLDYHEFASIRVHPDWKALRTSFDSEASRGARLLALTTRAATSVYDHRFGVADWLVFGCETSGLPESILAGFAPAERLALPMRPGMRSLNLSNAVAVTVFEAWRQSGFAGAAAPGASGSAAA